jgi:hypothetical protein
MAKGGGGRRRAMRQTMGLGQEDLGPKMSTGKNGGSRGAIYRGQVGHWRGTRRNKGCH